ncbi:unnamed protein product [Cyprideis torosa]|uniref:Mediator of RNA polymerase II transcription subunit 6 n=1 Tax=Cyprideis torosa TaxID=163714 RepID=A0A7R8WFS7_9CRUS|nr:unnamed protein product [Cyprideis torosa]CAG0891778.1 unnamed protein product [Cyprideis torosa]
MPTRGADFRAWPGFQTTAHGKKCHYKLPLYQFLDFTFKASSSQSLQIALFMANIAAESPLGVSWHNSAAIPGLNPTNVLDYFMDRSNPFYDISSNNESIRMQRLSQDKLRAMTGLEYMVLHVQDPILYVIRKQHRHSPDQVTPTADYYIIAGVVYQAPDLATVINSRVLSVAHHLSSAFEEASSYSQYHPSKGYWWKFPSNDLSTQANPNKEKEKGKSGSQDEPSSLFQRQRVDVLLSEWTRRFPPKIPAQFSQQPTPSLPPPNRPGSQAATANGIKDSENGAQRMPVEIKTEPMSPAGVPPSPATAKSAKAPPEKKARIG